MRAVLYGRYSSHNQKDASIEQQFRDCRAFCENNDIKIISEYADMVTGRIGVPDPERGIAVIGLIVEGTNERVGAFTGKLGNVTGVSVKSALTTKTIKEHEEA